MLVASANILILIVCMLITLYFYGFKDCTHKFTSRFVYCSWTFLFLFYLVFFIVEIVFFSLAIDHDNLLNA